MCYKVEWEINQVSRSVERILPQVKCTYNSSKKQVINLAHLDSVCSYMLDPNSVLDLVPIYNP